jgi:hypothetical protein
LGDAFATRAGSFDRKSTMPSSVTFCRVLSNSMQNGSASGSGTSASKPACWSVHANGIEPS